MLGSRHTLPTTVYYGSLPAHPRDGGEPAVASGLGRCQPPPSQPTHGCPRVPLSFSMPQAARLTFPSILPKSDA